MNKSDKLIARNCKNDNIIMNSKFTYKSGLYFFCFSLLNIYTFPSIFGQNLWVSQVWKQMNYKVHLQKQQLKHFSK